MKRDFNFYLILMALLFIGCNKDEPKLEPVIKEPKTFTLTTRSPQVIKSSNEFGIKLFGEVAKVSKKDNMMLSPLSASTALTMLLNGCDGATYAQMNSMLNYPSDLSISQINEEYKSLVSQLLKADSKVAISLANAVFYKNSLTVKKPFINSLKADFDATIKALNFRSSDALNTINKWASDNTNEKITKVLDGIPDNAVMFLMNALYFKGNWASQFEKTNTQPKPFNLLDGTTINVPTMMGDVNVKATNGNTWRALELPYGRTNFTMVIVVPEKSLPVFINDFSSDVWQDIVTTIDAEKNYSKMQVVMPKFQFSYEKHLNDHLKSMGMTDAFDSHKANLSKIADDTKLYISFVKQNTFVDVNEEGTEAAAVTTIEVLTSSPEPRKFIIDKPFVFAIRERTTNTLLFIGQVVNPLN